MPPRSTRCSIAGGWARGRRCWCLARQGAAGADDVVVYPHAPLDRDASKALAEAFKAAVGPKGADVVFDPVGGDYAEPALRAIGWGGRYFGVGFPAGIPELPV